VDKVRLGRTAVLSDLGHGISPVYYFKGVVMLSSEAGFPPRSGCCWRCERRRISHGLSPSQLRTDPARLSLLHRMGVLRRVSQNSPSNPCPPTLERRLGNWGTPPNPRREAYRTSFETASASQTAVPWSECAEPPDRRIGLCLGQDFSGELLGVLKVCSVGTFVQALHHLCKLGVGSLAGLFHVGLDLRR
jgi:hypothetical protein